MIRTVCLFLLLAAGDTLSAQQCICWRRDKVTQLIFSSEVVKFRAGYTSNDAVSQSDGPVLYIQPVDSLAESNLNVITADGCYYAFNVIYDSTAAMVNYIITPSMAFYRENTATHPAAVGEQQPAETSAPTDGLDPKEQTPKDPLEIVGKKPDYIVANNIARLQKLVFMLKGCMSMSRMSISSSAWRTIAMWPSMWIISPSRSRPGKRKKPRHKSACSCNRCGSMNPCTAWGPKVPARSSMPSRSSPSVKRRSCWPRCWSWAVTAISACKFPNHLSSKPANYDTDRIRRLCLGGRRYRERSPEELPMAVPIDWRRDETLCQTPNHKP